MITNALYVRITKTKKKKERKRETDRQTDREKNRDREREIDRERKDIKRDVGFKADCPLRQLLFSSSTHYIIYFCVVHYYK